MSLATSNAFAALDTKKKKKSKSKEEGGEKKKKQPVKTTDAADLEKAVFSQAKINVSNWADTDDDDDDFGDDFGGQPPWLQASAGVHAALSPQAEPESEAAEAGHDSEEDDHEELERILGVEITKDKEEEEERHAEEEAPLKATPALPAAPIQHLPPERMLSKKEQKQKEMEELNNALADLGLELDKQDTAGDEHLDEEALVKKEKKRRKAERLKQHLESAHANGSLEPGENGQELDTSVPPKDVPAADAGSEADEPAQLIDPAQARKALAAKKAAASKKGSSSASAAAAKEAKERAKKKASKKDTKHYNQAPIR